MAGPHRNRHVRRRATHYESGQTRLGISRWSPSVQRCKMLLRGLASVAAPGSSRGCPRAAERGNKDREICPRYFHECCRPKRYYRNSSLMMRVYAVMAQKERELISERARAAPAAAKARRGSVLGEDYGYSPAMASCAAAAASLRVERAEQAAQRLWLAVERL